jgi:general secretion pathway protein A
MRQAVGLDADAAAYWGLAGVPFEADPRAAAILPSTQHAEALARIEYLAERGHGSGAVTGPRGCGKSQLLSYACATVARMQRTVCHIDAAALDESRLHWELAAGLGLRQSPAESPLAVWQLTCDALHGCREVGEPLVLFVDHVEQMAESGVRALTRLLRDPELSSGIVLVWAATAPLIGIARSELLPLTDLGIELDSLNAIDTAALVRQSLNHAGASRAIFDDDAAEAVHARSGGELRRIGRLCRFALLAAMADEQPAVSRDLVEAAAAVIV